MESVDLSIDSDNELNFMVTVEGTRPGESSCRFLIEGPEMSYAFPGEIDQSGEVCVTIPSMNRLIKEGEYKSMLEVFVDDRVFIPLEMNINFEKVVQVKAEAIVRKSKTKPGASATLINKSFSTVERPAPKPPAMENISKVNEAKNSETFKKAKKSQLQPKKNTRRQVSLNDLTEAELRQIIRKSFLEK